MKQLLRKRWTRRLLAVLTAVLVIGLLTHPELRLLAPLFDALGVDGLVLLLSAPLLSALRALPWRVWYVNSIWPLLAGSAFLILAGEHLGRQIRWVRSRLLRTAAPRPTETVRIAAPPPPRSKTP